MNTYTIYLGAAPIACVSGDEYALAVFRKTAELAEMLGMTADLEWDDSEVVLEHYDPDDF